MEHSMEDSVNSSVPQGDCNPMPTKPKNKKVIRVGPWRNREEFVNVYNWLFGENVTEETIQKAYDRMVIWKMRRSDQIPATILGTLVLIEIQLKDKQSQYRDYLSASDLQIMYSSAFTRFINYVSSIHKTRMKTMYQTASRLGLSSFLIDVRHLCAHGNKMPDLEVFQAITVYCLNWVKQYYWDHQLQNTEDVDAKYIRRLGFKDFDQDTSQSFMIYDAITEAILKNCCKLQKAKKCLSPNTYIMLKRFSNTCNCKELKPLLKICLKKLSSIIEKEDILRGGSQAYLESLMNMNFFFESAAYRTTTRDEIVLLIDLHQPLFQLLAACGFIQSLLRRMVLVCENELEAEFKRKGAGFWAYQLAKGYSAFIKVKLKFLTIVEKYPEKRVQLNNINTQSTSRKILKLYRNFKYDVKTTLIFGDSDRYPWSLSFSRDYIQERIMKAKEFTIDAVKQYLELADPPFDSNEITTLNKLIDIYYKQNTNEENSTNENDEKMKSPTRKNEKTEDTIYNLSHVLGNADIQMDNDSGDDDGIEKFGIFTRVPYSQLWRTCPIGTIICD